MTIFFSVHEQKEKENNKKREKYKNITFTYDLLHNILFQPEHSNKSPQSYRIHQFLLLQVLFLKFNELGKMSLFCF